MSAPHIGDEPAGGLCRLGQRLDVAGVAGTHLYDGNLVFGAQAQQRLWHAHVVVEVALCGQHVVLLAEHGLHQFLRRGLAVGAGDAYDGNVELTAVLACQQLQGLQRVADGYEALAQRGIGLGQSGAVITDDGQGAALLQGLQGEAVAVEVVAFQCQEDAALGAVAAVGGDARVLLVQSV